MVTNIIPKEITRDRDNGTEVASFGYYDGIEFARQNNLKHTTLFTDVCKHTHYMVCCGDVMVVVNPTDYPQIQRREI